MVLLFQCSEFEKAGAQIGTTPSDVIEASDITFSCVANPQAAKEVSNVVRFFCICTAKKIYEILVPIHLVSYLETNRTMVRGRGTLCPRL